MGNSETIPYPEIAIRVDHLSVNYDKTPVLWDIFVDVPAGKLVGIIGPNGAGKSTLLKAALGLIKPLSGSVRFFGKPLKEVQQKIAYVPQRESVDWDFPVTVLELVLMGRFGKLGLFRRPSRADVADAIRTLESVGMEAFRDRQISQLSGGQQQRVFLARALMQQAEIYLMDEPFAGVDQATEKVLVDLMRTMQQEGKTVCIVHHDLNTVESYFDWLIMLNLRLVASGACKKVFTEENLNATYGKQAILFDEAAKLAREKSTGLIE